VRVLISGSSGMIGQALTARLRQGHHQVCFLLRDPSRARPGDLPWQPGRRPDPGQLAAFDAVVHLAGSPISRRWTDAAKAEIHNSRVAATTFLSRGLAHSFQVSGKPHTLLCSSAVGYYGSRGGEELVEESASGQGFLAEVCRGWEHATQPAAEAGMRVVHMRTALVLSPSGGALGAMLPGFRMGVAGKLGTGQQWWSWVSLEDAVRAFLFALENGSLRGPLNLASPGAVTNEEFTRILGRVLGRPTLLSAPAFLLRLAAGEMADELLLASQRVLPRRLLQAGFHFEDAELEPTLHKLLDAPALRAA
jgi:uncharacterized protein (TIGR01777 family)